MIIKKYYINKSVENESTSFFLNSIGGLVFDWPIT